MQQRQPDAQHSVRRGRPPKLWAAFEIGWFRDPRVRRLSTEAKLLFLAGRAYCSEQGTDGHIDRDAVQMIAADAKVHPGNAATLVRAGLWEDSGESYHDVDYLRTNQKAEVRERRWEQDRIRKAQAPPIPDFPDGFPRGNGPTPAEFPHGFPSVRAEHSTGET